MNCIHVRFVVSKIGKGTGFSPNTSAVSIISPKLHTHFTYMLLLSKGKQAKQITFVKAESFWKPVSFGYRRTFISPGFQGINLKITSSYSQFMTEMAACMSRVPRTFIQKKTWPFKCAKCVKTRYVVPFLRLHIYVIQMTRLFLVTFTNTSRRPQIYSESLNPLKCRKRNLQTNFSNLGRFYFLGDLQYLRYPSEICVCLQFTES